MYNRRVLKSDDRVEAYGTVDELNAHLGVARASLGDSSVAASLLVIQKNLVVLMGELAVDPRDFPRYRESSHPKMEAGMLDWLHERVRDVESRSVKFDGWATPGGTLAAAHLDVARTVCRRAERAIVRLDGGGAAAVNPLIIQFLNRLADLLWLMAREEESRA
jgi:cob(I)alamin adenosyltransferase